MIEQPGTSGGHGAPISLVWPLLMHIILVWLKDPGAVSLEQPTAMLSTGIEA
jgi:hypothetical protein